MVNQQELRIMIVTVRILQFCANIFAVFGLCLFGYIYMHHFKDQPAEVVRDPFFIITILIPFVPAAVLAWSAARKRKQIRAMLFEQQEGK